MSFDLRSQDAGDGLRATDRESPVPGRRSAVDDHGEASPALFAKSAEWEDVDPLALDEAHQPGEDEDGEVGSADEEGEPDHDSDDGDDNGVAAHAPPAHAAVASAGPAATAKAPGAQTYRVNRAYRDGPYGGTAKYDVRVTAKSVTMIVGIRLKPKKGVSAAQVRQVKRASQAIFKQKYDARFKLTEIPYKPRPLHAKVRFSGKAHHEVNLHKGDGRDNAANWFVKGDRTTRAHEIGHLLGLLDEYADSASPDRKVYTDNSLMGNYYQEGIKTAKLKKRHGNVFARDISRASGRKFYRSP